MNAVDNALMTTGDQAPEFSCSAVWGGKLSARETVLGFPLVWQASAAWGSRVLMNEQARAERAPSAAGKLSQVSIARGERKK